MAPPLPLPSDPDAAHSSSPRRLERVGHRGAPREFPENNLPAFERALARGAEAVELDVHVTADGVPVVHHDPIIARAVSYEHVGRPLASMTWREVAATEIARNIAIPSLKQVLDLIASRGTVYVELKGERVENAVVQCIRQSTATCAVHSFDHDAVARAAALAPELRRGILFDSAPRDVRRAMRQASALDVWPQWELIDPELVRAVHDEGGRVIAWTVNTVDAAAALIDVGVDAICTDDVRLLQRATG